MKTCVYAGPCDRLRVGGRFLYRNVPTEVPNDLAAKVADNPRVTVKDADEPEAGDGHTTEV